MPIGKPETENEESKKSPSKTPGKTPARAGVTRKRAAIATPAPSPAVSTAVIEAEPGVKPEVVPAIEPAPMKRAVKSVSAAADPEMVILDPTREEIAMRAYELYVARGRRDGHSDSDWTRAEQELNAERERARMALRGPSSRSTTES